MKEKVMDKYMVSSGSVVHGGDLGFHKEKEFLDQGKITVNFLKEYCILWSQCLG
jgi:hypothetical protein